jgi:hypothetical protein
MMTLFHVAAITSILNIAGGCKHRSSFTIISTFRD